MSGISDLFNVGTSGLFSYQRALTVTSHNLANVHTKGYSKQEAVLSEASPMDGRPGQIGTGVEVAAIRRSFDTLINQQVLSSQERLGQFDASRGALAEIERLFSDAQNQSLGTDLNELFKAFQDVATNPSDLTARSTLLTKAQALTDRFHQVDSSLSDQRQALDRQVGQTITDINGLAGQIANLNDKISQAESAGQRANDLRDQRQKFLNELSGLIDVSTIEDTSGQVTVFVGKGNVLVDKKAAHSLTGVPFAGNGGLLDVQINQAGALVSLSAVISGGRLKGLLDARDQTIPGLLGQLDSLAQAVVTEVNQQHSLGFGLDGL
jgi:flagellar hook-associated protein 1 FlgK